MEDHLHFVTEGHKFPNLKSYKGKHLNKSAVVPEQWALKPNSSGITGKWKQVVIWKKTKCSVFVTEGHNAS